MDSKQRAEAGLKDPQDNACKILEEAVANARSLVQEGSKDVTEDTIGQRLLGLALAHMDGNEQDGTMKACSCISEAREIHIRTGRWQALARLVYTLLGIKKRDEAWTAQPILRTETEQALEAAMKVFESNVSDDAGPLAAVEAGAVAQLCYAVAVIKDPGVAATALCILPNLEPSMLVKLGQMAGEGTNSSEEKTELDKIVKAAAASVPSEPKTIIFVVDRTWAPILGVGIDSIKTIIKEHTNEGDVVGLYGLGDGFLINPQRRPTDPNALVSATESARKTSGQCVLYKSMVAALDKAASLAPSSNTWVVILTDLVDTDQKCSVEHGAARVRDKIKQATSSLTIAIIDSSAISGWQPADYRWPAYRSNVKLFLDTLRESGFAGHHLVADDLEGLKAKFQEVAALMADDGLVEHL